MHFYWVTVYSKNALDAISWNLNLSETSKPIEWDQAREFSLMLRHKRQTGEKFMQFNLQYFPFYKPTAKCGDLEMQTEAFSTPPLHGL